MDWFPCDNGLRHESVKLLFCLKTCIFGFHLLEAILKRIGFDNSFWQLWKFLVILVIIKYIPESLLKVLVNV